MSGQGDNRSGRRNGDSAIPAAQKVASRRRREPGELYIAQTSDYAAAAKVAAGAGGVAGALAGPREMPGVCWLAASLDSRMVGAVAIEMMVDAAVICALAVVEPMRKRGVGTALIEAARKAAHTRGARRLYALGCGGEYLARFGFERVAPDALLDDLAGTFVAEYLSAHPEQLSGMAAMLLDISRDGVIER